MDATVPLGVSERRYFKSIENPRHHEPSPRLEIWPKLGLSTRYNVHLMIVMVANSGRRPRYSASAGCEASVEFNEILDTI